MTAVGHIPFGVFPQGMHAAISVGNTTLNSGGASIDRLMMTLQMPVADTITHLCFRYGTRTGTPVAHQIGLWDFTAARLPNAIIAGKLGAFTPPADTTWNGTWREILLDNSYAAARGEILCVVIEPTGTPDGSNNSSFTRTWSSNHSGCNPYSATQTDGAAWVRSSLWPIVAAKSATAVYGFPYLSTFSTNLATNGHRQTNKITFPGTGTFSCSGLKFAMGSNTAAGSVIYGIWNAAGTLLTGTTVDSDGLSANDLGCVLFDDAAVNLDRGTAYYCGIERVDVATRLYGFLVNGSGDMAAYPLGTSCIGSTWDGATWTDAATTRFWVGPVVDDLTVSGGGGGLLRHPGMCGGLSA